MRTLTENIPEELQQLQRWVCANADSKRPMRTYEAKPASVSKPDTWGSFAEASRRIEDGAYEFAGFVFDDDGFVGIDIDRGFDEEGFPTEEALEAIKACASYTEVSKSGKGFHIICKGKLPFKGKNNRAGWEIYETGRFFVLTGRVVGAYRNIAEAQEGIDLILSKHFEDVEKNGSESHGELIWRPIYALGDKLPGCPTFAPVRSGSRHLSLVSYCGQMHSAGASKEMLYRMASAVNERYLVPPLEDAEVHQVVDSVSRYRR